MRKESPLIVKVEQEKNESNLSSFGALPTFLEFLNGFKFHRMHVKDHIISRFISYSVLLKSK